MCFGRCGFVVVCIRLNVTQSGNEGLYGTLQLQSTSLTEETRTTERPPMSPFYDLLWWFNMYHVYGLYTPSTPNPSSGKTTATYPPVPQPQLIHFAGNNITMRCGGGGWRAMHWQWLTDPHSLPFLPSVASSCKILSWSTTAAAALEGEEVWLVRVCEE